MLNNYIIYQIILLYLLNDKVDLPGLVIPAP